MDNLQLFSVAAYLMMDSKKDNPESLANNEYEFLLAQRRQQAALNRPITPSLGQRIAASLRAAVQAFQEPARFTQASDPA